MTRTWTETDDEIASLASKADAVEVAACIDEGSAIERTCSADPADLCSVYLHFTPEWTGDPNGLGGAICIADRDTLAQARAFALEVATRGRTGGPLPVNDYTATI